MNCAEKSWIYSRRDMAFYLEMLLFFCIRGWLAWLVVGRLFST